MENTSLRIETLIKQGIGLSKTTNFYIHNNVLEQLFLSHCWTCRFIEKISKSYYYIFALVFNYMRTPW